MNMLAPRISARYQPLAQIGRGGMAEVILAQTQVGADAGRLVVLKRLWPELGDDPDFVAMFLHEARLCMRMSHPNVVRTHEIVEDAEGTAIAMEYLDGQPLSRVLARLLGAGSLGLGVWLRVLLDVLEALDYAHALRDPDGRPAGIVHRDVNPQNVFVTHDGAVKLLDFGVAKSARDMVHTRPGELRGKLAYLAPEQALGELVDRRADVFSVGVMLWEILAGRRMWQATTESGVLRRLAAGVIPPLPPDAAGPPEVREVCARALARTAEGRYATAGEMAEALRPLVGSGARDGLAALGPAVSLAFAPERAARQTLIDEHLRRARLTWGGLPPDEVGSTAHDAEQAVELPDETVELSLDDVLEDAPAVEPAEASGPSADDAAVDEGVAAAVPAMTRAGTILTSAIIPGPPPPPPPPPTLTWAMVVGSLHRSGALRRAGWMVMGLALAAVGGAAYAARSWAHPVAAAAGAPVAAPAPPAVPVQPIIVGSPPGGAEVACPGAPPVAASAFGAPALAAPEGRRYRRRARAGTGADGEPERPRRADGVAEAPRAAGRPSAAASRFDDETLEPTIDLSGVAPAPAAVAASPPAPPRAPSPPAPLAATRRGSVRTIDVADPFAP